MKIVLSLILAVVAVSLTTTVMWALAPVASGDLFTPGWVQCLAIVVLVKMLFHNPEVG